MKPSMHHHQSGFTLVEIIASMVILGVGLASIIALQSSAFKGTTTVTSAQKQKGVAQECAEQILGVAATQGWDELTANGRFGNAKCDSLTAQSGYAIPSVSFSAYSGSACPSGYTCNLVTVTAPASSGSPVTTLTLMVVNY